MIGLDIERAKGHAKLQAQEEEKTKHRAEDETKETDNDTLPTFDLELLPHNVQGYAHDVARRMNNAPISFSATAALLVLSSSIGRRVGIRPKRRDSWTVIPNLWGMLIAPPSIKKSPIFTEMIKPLQKLEIEASERYNEEMAAFNLQKIAYDIEMKAYKEKLKEGEQPTPPEPIKEPTRTRYLINDATIEKVAEIMIHNPDGLTLFMDELAGWFQTLGKAGREGDRSFWLEAFNGNGSRSVDRIGRGSLFVPNVCTSIFGTIQPDALMGMVSRTTSQTSGGDGLLQRFQLIAFEENSPFEFIDEPPNTFAKEAYEATVAKMVTSNPVDYGAYKDSITEELYYRFNEEATRVYRQFSIANNKEVGRYAKTNPAMAAHLGKFDGFFASLALMLFYADRIVNVTTAKEIPKEYAVRAWKLCDFYKAHAMKVYNIERIKERKQEALEEKIIAKVKELLTHGKTPTFGQVAQRVWGASAKDVAGAVKGIFMVRGKKIVSHI